METITAAPPGRTCRGDRRRASTACVLPAITASVPALRRLALSTVRRWRLPEETGEALGLIVTELVTNAVRHSGGPDVTLRLCAAAGALTVQVSDSGHWRPRISPPDDDTPCGGRGLLLVQTYATTCTVHASPHGTTVTAELLLPLPA